MVNFCKILPLGSGIHCGARSATGASQAGHCREILNLTIGLSISAEKAIPKIVDHREIAACMPVMDEVQLLLLPEPCKASKPGPLYVVFFVEKDVRVE